MIEDLDSPFPFRLEDADIIPPNQKAGLLNVELYKREVKVVFESFSRPEILETLDACTEQAGEGDNAYD